MVHRALACVSILSIATSFLACSDDDDDGRATSSGTPGGGSSSGSSSSSAGGASSSSAGAGGAGGGTGAAGGGGAGATGGAGGEGGQPVGGAGGDGGAGGGGAQLTCQQIQMSYANAVNSAKACDPGDTCVVLDGQCNVGLGGCFEVVVSTLPQGQLDFLGQQWQANQCGGGICDCPPPPAGAACVAGMCAGL